MPIAGHGGVPATGVAAVVLNLTATNSESGGYLTVFPTGSVRPTTSSLNVPAHHTVANLVVAKLGSNGSVTVHNGPGAARTCSPTSRATTWLGRRSQPGPSERCHRCGSSTPGWVSGPPAGR